MRAQVTTKWTRNEIDPRILRVPTVIAAMLAVTLALHSRRPQRRPVARRQMAR
jgi:hypothetical protein